MRLHWLRFGSLGVVGVMLVAGIGFYASTLTVQRHPINVAKDELAVVLSPPVQVALSLGDRYLAAELLAVRMLVVDVINMPQEQRALLAQIHRNIAFLNPCHEDNYYIAQAFLAEFGFVKVQDEILGAAQECRSWDFMVPFWRAFTASHYSHDYIRAGDYYVESAKRATGEQREQMLYLASRQYAKQDDAKFTARVFSGLRDSSTNPRLKEYLQIRVLRMERLAILQEAAKLYQRKTSKKLSRVEDLVSAGVVPAIPEDPLGKGYQITNTGSVEFRP